MLNRITIMGRLVRDPDIKTTPSGVNVANFCIACDRDYANGDQKETDFVNIVSWRGTADFVKRFFTKGRMAVISGRLQIRNYTDKDGNKRTAAEVVADSVYFGDSKPSNGGSQAQAAAPTDFPELPDDDSELPFV